MLYDLKLKAAAGLLSCGFFLFSGDMRSDILPEEKPHKLSLNEFQLSGKEQERLSRNIKYASFLSRYLQKDPRKRLEKKDLDEVLSILQQDPQSVFLTLFFAGEYKKLSGTEEKLLLAEKLEKTAERFPESFFLVSVASDMLRELKKNERSRMLLEKSIPCICRMKKDGCLDGAKKEYALYIIRSLCREYAFQKMYEKGILLLEKIFEHDLYKEDLLLLQYALFHRYFLHLSAPSERKNKLFFWQKSRKEEAWEELEKCIETYRNLVRKSHAEKKSIFPGMQQTAFQILSRIKKYEEMPSSILLEEAFAVPEEKRTPLLFLADDFAIRKEENISARIWKKFLDFSYLPPDDASFLILSVKLQKAGDWTAAVKAQEMAYIANPHNQRIAMDLAKLYAVKERYKEAIKVLEAFFPDVEALHMASSILQASSDTEQALFLLLQADLLMDKRPFAVFPGNKGKRGSRGAVTAGGEALSRFIYRQFQIAICAEKLKKHFLVEKHLKKLLAADPGNVVAMNFLGYHLACNNKDLPFAEKLILLALEKEPENYAFLDSLAWVKYRKKDFAGAKIYIDKAMENAGKESGNTDAVILDHAGDIYFAAGKNKEALQFLEKALKIYSTELDAEEVLKKLEKVKKILEKKK